MPSKPAQRRRKTTPSARPKPPAKPAAKRLGPDDPAPYEHEPYVQPLDVDALPAPDPSPAPGQTS